MNDAPRPQTTGYGLPCAKCHRYFPADLPECPICKSKERVAAVAPPSDPARRKRQSFAAPTSAFAALTQEQTELLKELAAPVLVADAHPSTSIGQTPVSDTGLDSPSAMPVESSIVATPLDSVPRTSLQQWREELVKEFESAGLTPRAEVCDAAMPESQSLPSDGKPSPPSTDGAPEQLTLSAMEPAPEGQTLEQQKEDLSKEFNWPVFVVGSEAEESEPAITAGESVADGSDQPAGATVDGTEQAPASLPDSATSIDVKSEVDAPAPGQQREPEPPPFRNVELVSPDLVFKEPPPLVQPVSPVVETPPSAEAPVESTAEPKPRQWESPADKPPVVYLDLRHPARGRQLDIATMILGVIVLGFAVLMSILIGIRLGGYQIGSRHSAGAESLSAAEPSQSQPDSQPASDQPGEAQQNSASSHASLPVAPSATAAQAKTKPVQQSERQSATLPLGPSPMEKVKAIPPQPTSSGQPVVLSADVAEDNLIDRIEPDYPDDARQRGVQGAVVLDLYIRKDGTVQNVGLVSGPPPLVAAAISAVRQWRFTPFRINGREVETKTRVTLGFTVSR